MRQGGAWTEFGDVTYTWWRWCGSLNAKLGVVGGGRRWVQVGGCEWVWPWREWCGYDVTF